MTQKNELIEIIKNSSLKELIQVTRNIDDSDKWQYSLILLAAFRVGTTTQAICEFTRLPVDMVQPAVHNLVHNGVFIGDELNCKWLDDEKWSGVGLLLDSSVAQGSLKRVYNDSQEVSYQATAQGIEETERLIKNDPEAQRLFDQTLKKEIKAKNPKSKI